MIKYIFVFVIVANSCCGAEYTICCGHKFTIDLDLTNPVTSQYFISSTNAELFNDGDTTYWRSIDFTKDSEVLYRVTSPAGTLFTWSSWITNIGIQYDTKQEYIEMYASEDNVRYARINWINFPNTNSRLSRDTSFASHGNNQVFLKGKFKGELVQFLKPGTHFDFSVIPEPSSLLLFVTATLLFPMRITRRI